MPVMLPNGVYVLNATPHDLIFYDRNWQPKLVVVSSEVVINAYSKSTKEGEDGAASYVTVEFLQRQDSVELIERIKAQYPGVKIVGSIIAAQAYPEDVVSPIPWYKGTRGKNAHKLLRPDRFTIYKKEKVNV